MTAHNHDSDVIIIGGGHNGLPDVVRQGPLNQAFLYHYFTSWLHDPSGLVATEMRFIANVFPNDVLQCGGGVLDLVEEPGAGGVVNCAIWQLNQDGQTILKGEAKGRVKGR